MPDRQRTIRQPDSILRMYQDLVTLEQARTIIAGALAESADHQMKPLAVVVLDAGGHLIAAERQDGSSFLRPEVGMGKAYGALSLGMGSRAIHARAEQQSYFINAINGLTGGRLVPVPGGVLIRDTDGNVLGAVGISGDVSDNDERAAVAGIRAAGLEPDAG